ncbi:hypothetical protein CsSME_00015088 [Camellia sinensis var. sinensis]
MDRSMSEWMRSRRKYKFPKKRGGQRDLAAAAKFDCQREHQRVNTLSRVAGENKKKEEVTDEGGQVQVAAVARPNYGVATLLCDVAHNWLQVLEEMLQPER